MWPAEKGDFGGGGASPRKLERPAEAQPLWGQQRPLPRLPVVGRGLRGAGTSSVGEGGAHAGLSALIQVASPSEGHHTSLSVHALNVFTGLPATGLAVHLSQLRAPNQAWMELMTRWGDGGVPASLGQLGAPQPHPLSSDCSATSTDGRMDRSELASLQLESGTYKLRFATGEYWQQQGLTSFYPYVEVSFRFSCTRASDLGRPVVLGPPTGQRLWGLGLWAPAAGKVPLPSPRGPATLPLCLLQVVFTLTAAERKVHIPLLLSPYSYVTYRGS